MSINLKDNHLLFITISMIALMVAYFVEYFMSLVACPLCVYQRFPYVILIFIAIIGIASNHKLTRYYVLTIIVAIILSVYHTGIEHGLFEMSSLCKPLVQVRDDLSIAEFQKMLPDAQIGVCNKPALVICGLSMTEWNLFFNIILLLITLKNK